MRLKLLFVFAAVCVLLGAPAAACAYTAEITPFDEEQAARTAHEGAEHHEQGKEAKAAEERHTAEERKAAVELSQHEMEERRRREESEYEQAQTHEEAQHKAGKAATSQCVVPSLAGDSLGRARKALRRAHCTLGHVSTSRGHGKLVVTAQGQPAESRHPAGTAVVVTLGPVRRRRR